MADYNPPQIKENKDLNLLDFDFDDKANDIESGVPAQDMQIKLGGDIPEAPMSEPFTGV